MQKKLIALAIAGLASSAAFAQTNVTLYGVADVTVESVQSAGNNAGANFGRYGRVNSNSSYIGFKGVEDLGDGLKALFQFEQGVNADGVGTVLGGTNRDTFVGLKGNFGTAVAGNLSGATRVLGNRMEMLPGNTGIGDAVSLLGNPGNVANTGTTGTFDTRMTNTIAYISNDYNGLNFMVDYMFGENKNLDNAAASSNAKAWELGANYTTGGWDLGYVYGKVDAGNSAAAALDTVTNNRLGVGYNFDGGHKVTFQWNRWNQDMIGGGDLRATSYSLQGKYAVSAAGSLIADYTVAKDITGSLGANDTGAKMITLGYLHNLSKRTMVKAVYSRITNDAAAAYNFSSGKVAGTGAFGVDSDPSGFAVGVRHSF